MTEASADGSGVELKKTPLHSLHVELGARMVPFAGYDMPVQYPAGIIKEHQHTREKAGFFDVSHMGQAWLIGKDADAALERIVPADILSLAPGQQRYTQFTNQDGGILDDLMVTRPADPMLSDRLFLVVNAACKDQDYAHIGKSIGSLVKLERLEDRALFALQGPKAVDVMLRLFDGAETTQPFMTQKRMRIDDVECLVSRSGYTGEDGFEISVPADRAEVVARQILADPDVEPVGLGARDSLRLESGLCLYGHDIDTTTSPVEAGLLWSIGKRRRTEGGFPGAARIQKEIAEGVSRRRVGIRPDGRAPAREGTKIVTPEGREIGVVTSGGFGPSVGGPVAMGYVAKEFAGEGTAIGLLVRDKVVSATIVKMPFVPARFYRG